MSITKTKAEQELKKVQKNVEQLKKREEQLKGIIEKANNPKEPKLVERYEEACKMQKRKPLKLTDLKMFPTEEREYYFAIHKLTVIHASLNGDWMPDYNPNNNEYKWFPNFDMRGSGFVFSSSYYFYDDFYSLVGAALVLKNEVLSDYSGTQFSEIWRQFLKPTFKKIKTK